MDRIPHGADQRADTTETDLFRVVTGGNLGMRRDTILELGGFDTGFDRWGAEDTELGY